MAKFCQIEHESPPINTTTLGQISPIANFLWIRTFNLVAKQPTTPTPWLNFPSRCKRSKRSRWRNLGTFSALFITAANFTLVRRFIICNCSRLSETPFFNYLQHIQQNAIKNMSQSRPLFLFICVLYQTVQVTIHEYKLEYIATPLCQIM